MDISYYDDNTLITVGKHSGKRIREIPTDYLLSIHRNKEFPDRQLILFIENNIERIKKIHQGIEQFSKPAEHVPCTKAVYLTKSLARAALQTIRERPGDHRKPIRSYPCDNCSGWHLTSWTVQEWAQLQNKKQQTPNQKPA